MTFSETLYSTVAGDVVREGDASAAFLLGVKGQTVPPKWRAKVAALIEPETEPPSEPTEVTTNDPEISHRDPPTRRRGRPPRHP